MAISFSFGQLINAPKRIFDWVSSTLQMSGLDKAPVLAVVESYPGFKKFEWLRTCNSRASSGPLTTRAVAMRRFKWLGRPVAVCIGISAGQPIAAENALFGSLVNLAARLCQRTERGRILVSERLKGLAGSRGRSGNPLQARLRGSSSRFSLKHLASGLARPLPLAQKSCDCACYVQGADTILPQRGSVL